MAYKSLHIEGRRWFQRSYGNTYHSVRIFIDGELAFNSGIHYGYGEQFLQTAMDILRKHDVIPPQEYYDNGNPKHNGSYYLRETLKGSYSVIDVSRQRDL